MNRSYLMIVILMNIIQLHSMGPIGLKMMHHKKITALAPFQQSAFLFSRRNFSSENKYEHVDFNTMKKDHFQHLPEWLKKQPNSPAIESYLTDLVWEKKQFQDHLSYYKKIRREIILAGIIGLSALSISGPLVVGTMHGCLECATWSNAYIGALAGVPTVCVGGGLSYGSASLGIYCLKAVRDDLMAGEWNPKAVLDLKNKLNTIKIIEKQFGTLKKEDTLGS